ncbi:hypothetical protein [Streptomyces sp. Ag109_O5-10]|uniref:hypothetical protein n=1 Tax=Streptomyces sp. Ag109_O5-10 TaxID=1855349 RepID=UPI000B88C3F4|nr:hypothetical protein [Streptomyces sp. Ag109_O5-10]
MLYVDGKLTAARDWAYTPWNAIGSLQIGRELSSGAYGEYANAGISDVHVYNTVPPPAEAAATGANPAISQLD